MHLGIHQTEEEREKKKEIQSKPEKQVQFQQNS